MDKRLQELDNLAKGIEQNVYTSCLVNIFPQDFDNVYWAIETIKNQKELIESQARVLEGFIDDTARLVARNLVAWDTSKDKREGLLPEVYLKNKVVYQELTGEKYFQHKAVKKFNIE